MPESGGCERHLTDPFVNHINLIRSSSYQHKACLDQLHRNSSQPEALYINKFGSELVIERKSIVWPLDYAARHSNDHFIADALSKRLRDVTIDRPLTVEMEPSTLMPKAQLSAFAQEISDAIHAAIAELVDGRAIGSSRAGRRWICKLDAAERVACDDPETGLIVRWTAPGDIVPLNNLPSPIVDTLRKTFDKVVEKFQDYKQAKGILLLDPHGSIRFTGSGWWSQAFNVAPVPDAILEVWLATRDWITDTEQGWTFEQVHPERSQKDAA